MEAQTNRGPETPKSEPKEVDMLLGHPKAALTLGDIKFPVRMTRETLDEKVLEGPIKIETFKDLEDFANKRDPKKSPEHRKVEGYRRIKSISYDPSALLT